MPYRFELTSKEPFAFAGLWQIEEDSQGNKVPHSVIITTAPNEVVEDVHDRMPAILTLKNEKQWLNPDLSSEEAISLLKPYPAKGMEKYQISNLVNSPKNNSADLLKNYDKIFEIEYIVR